MINKTDVKVSLSLAGIEPGDVVLMHSAYTAIGGVEGGADALIDAVLEYLGSEGTLVMSSLTGWGAPFDPGKTPSGVGYISETFRKRPGVCRSLHPVHSVIAFGKDAEYITKDHEKCETGCGEGSPYLKIADMGGKILLLGVDEDRNTFLHCIEAYVNSPYLVEIDVPAPVYMPDQKTVHLVKFCPGHREFKGITPDLRREGLLTEAKMGRAVIRVMNAGELYRWGIGKLEKDPFYFLCDDPLCEFCSKARKGAQVPAED